MFRYFLYILDRFFRNMIKLINEYLKKFLVSIDQLCLNGWNVQLDNYKLSFIVISVKIFTKNVRNRDYD